MTITLPRYRLKFTNRYGETYYLVSLGDPWPHKPERRLIAHTTPKPEEAAVFDTLPEALEVLVTAGDPADWIAETLDGRAVG